MISSFGWIPGSCIKEVVPGVLSAHSCITCRSHEASPFGVTEDGDDGVAGVEDGIKRAILVHVQAGTYRVNEYPCYPLLDIFTGEHPHCHYAQCRGECVVVGHCTVGVFYKPVGENGICYGKCD